MHSTIHAVCGQQNGQNRAKSHVWLIFKKKKIVKRAGRHFGFFKRAGRHENGAGRRALQKKPRQNTAHRTHTGQEVSNTNHFGSVSVSLGRLAVSNQCTANTNFVSCVTCVIPTSHCCHWFTITAGGATRCLSQQQQQQRPRQTEPGASEPDEDDESRWEQQRVDATSE